MNSKSAVVHWTGKFFQTFLASADTIRRAWALFSTVEDGEHDGHNDNDDDIECDDVGCCFCFFSDTFDDDADDDEEAAAATDVTM
jgi:hypothetical protein